ncbi:molybdopterin cofactor-binding domain-containing protein [Allosphingosinicella sp.]|uniref:xanthine dehydrogenase family protein molybdopterin-binding subunit n=1 Tax=Allosphingosinicella sp. TaxID=2823234 RepID=UPI00378341B8
MARETSRGGLSRRQLLIGGGVGVGLLVAWTFWPRDYVPNLRAREGETVYNAYLKIGRDGHVTVAVPQAELGQGAWSALPQILADELGADWRTVAVEPAPLSPLYANTLLATEAADDSGWPSGLQGAGRWLSQRAATQNALMLTAGSSSVRAFDGPLREAGATARTMLCMAAAARWQANWEELDTRDGFVWRGNDRLPFAELAEGAAGYNAPDPVPLRENVDHRLAGQALPRLDAPAKVDGSALFAADVRFPDMAYAALLCGPWGSRLAGFDRAGANGIAGVLKIVEDPEWVAVVASNTWSAQKALNAMRPRFHLREPHIDERGISAFLQGALEAGEAVRVIEAGDPTGPFPGASPVTQTYEVGLAPAAAPEALSATVRILGDEVQVYAGCQAPGLAREAAARGAGVAAHKVTVFQTFAGGGYGRKLEVMAIEQAARLAKEAGRPVELSWSRIQEMARDSWRPAARGRLTGWMRQGRLECWEAKIAAPATAAEVAQRIGANGGFTRPGFAAVAGARPPYGIPNLAVDHVEAAIGIETGLWRGGAHSYTCFFTESFIDELALAAGLEPLAFRTFLLQDNPRLAQCLSTAASIGGWDGGARGSGMGLACHSAFGSHIACLVEVEVGGEQRLRVTRAVAAVDCGRVINPELIKQQIEGGIVHGVSAAVGRPVTFEGGMPAARSIGAYGLPVLRDAPEVSVELIDSDEPCGGITELGVPVAAPAIANAYFSLTGQRVRTLPIMVGTAA